MADKFNPTISTALPGASAARTAGIGSQFGAGLGKGLQSLLQDKLDRMVQKKQRQRKEVEREEGRQRKATALEGLGFSPEQAQQLSGFEDNLLKQLLSPRGILKPAKQKAPKKAPAKAAPKNMLKTRKNVVKQLKRKTKSPEKIYKELKSKGYDGSEISALMGGKLTEDIARFFLGLAKGNKNKARSIAKKYGYTL